MPTEKYASVCENKHPIKVGESEEDFDSDPYCGRCGEKVHTRCPSCEGALIPIRINENDDESLRWSLNDYCTECGGRYPWTTHPWRQKFQSLSQSLAEVDTGPSPKGIVLTQQRYDILSTLEYGSEVIKHVRDGDRCFNTRLWHPALAMFIHGFEWAAICYLKEEAAVDIIESERDGRFYSLAGRSPTLLDELSEHVEIDQKTESQIKSLNRIERRWMAHHKSGEIQQSEVEAVRSRLGAFLGTLYDDMD